MVMLISGLWHGANWTFVAWGGLLGVALLTEKVLGLGRLRFPPAVVAWFIVVQVTWILSLGFFRAQSIGEGAEVVAHAVMALPQWLNGSAAGFDGNLIRLGWWLTVPVWLLHLRSWAAERTSMGSPGRYERSWYAGIMLAAILTSYSDAQPFIYFQF
jgi:hypothetical protein